MKEHISYLPETIIDIIDKCRTKSLLEDVFLTNFERNCMSEMPLRIGVIGKMKAGKSTFLNALIFKDNVLGMSIVPMTAVLTEISYNENPESTVEVEFFSKDDIGSLKKAIADNTEDSKKYKEQMDAICAIDEYESKLGLSKSISTEELNEYTSTEGKMSALVKQVKIKYHNEALKGITIVDTPGFNDPIQSRVEATRIAIKNCQVLFFIHSTNSHYDASEVEILKSQVELAGTSKLIDIANRVDELKLEEWIQFKQNIESAKENLIRGTFLNGHALSLLKNSQTEYVSSLMALLGSRFAKSADITQDERRMACILCQEFDISLNDFLEYSNIGNIIKLVNSIALNKESLIQSSIPNELRGELIKAKEAFENEKGGLVKKKGILSSDIEVIKRELDSVDCLIPNIKNILSGQTIRAKLIDLISTKKWEFISDRDTIAQNHFTDTNYSNYGIGTIGIRLANLSKYNDKVADYISDLRRRLNKFKEDFRRGIDTYLDSLEGEMVQLDVGSTTSSIFMAQVKGLVSPIFSNLSCTVAHYGLNDKLKGNPQKDIYRNDFNNHFSDDYINKLFDGFIFIQSKFDFAEEVNSFRDCVCDLAIGIQRDLVRAIENPSEKEKQLKEIDTKIVEIDGKISELKNCIDSIESYIK